MEVLQRTANRGSISTGYDIDNSLKLENDNAEQLYYTPASAGNLQTWTYSCWFKRTELSYNMTLFGANATYVYFQTDDTLLLRFTGSNNFETTQSFRDTSAWYHFVIAVDTTQATSTDRIKIYVNGNQVTAFDTSTYPAQNTNTDWNNTLVHYVAGWATSTFNPSGYLAEVYNVDGQQLAPTDFGEFDEDTGIWKPKAYTGSYGTNGFFLEFQNGADLGEVSAGTQQNFVKSNITSADQATDTPTNNFCTMTSVANFYWEPKTRNATNGGTWVTDSSVTNNWTGTMCTTPLFTGKWYWEVYMFQPSEQMCGIHDFTGNVGSTVSTDHPYRLGNTWTVYGGGANWISYINGTETAGTSEPAFANGTIVGVALDLDNHVLTFYENGGSAGTNLTNIDISSLTNVYPGPWMPFVGVFRNSLQTNFGGFPGFTISSGNTDENGYGNFEYAPPSGFLAICSKNLAES